MGVSLLLHMKSELHRSINWKVIGNFRYRAHRIFQVLIAQNFPRAKMLSCISLDRKFHSAFSSMCPLSLRQKEIGENCRKLTVTLQHVLCSCLRMRGSVAISILFFVTTFYALIIHKI